MTHQHFQARQAASCADWLRIYFLYRRSFPRSERKPLSAIRGMQKKGKTDVWMFFRGGRFAGFATTINSERLILLDYLAVSPALRGHGVGSMALAQVRGAYPGRGIFVEVESIYTGEADLADQIRRRQFYLKNGMEPLHVLARVFGVEMELLGWDCQMDFDSYRGFYHDHNSPWAARHIENVEFPADI